MDALDNNFPTKTPILAVIFLDRILTLTTTEYEVFLKLGDGQKTSVICREEGKVKSIKTIESQVVSMIKKMGVADISQLRSIATRFLVYKEQNNIVREIVRDKIIKRGRLVSQTVSI